jgi:Meiotically up-regulated gene 113
VDNVTVRWDGLITRSMAAELCGVTPDAITQWIRRGHIKVIRREGRTPLLNLVEVAKTNYAVRKRGRRPEVPLPSWTLEGEPDVDMTPFVTSCAIAGRETSGLRDDTVYYILFGNRIKIGISSNLRSRLDSLPRGVRVLATEPGGRDVERERHEQFADCRVGGEWFRPTHALLVHVANLALGEGDV